MLQKLWDLVVWAVTYLFRTFFPDIVQTAVDWALGYIEGFVSQWFSQTPLSDVIAVLDHVQFFFPVYQVFAMTMGTLGVVASIRLFRWVTTIRIFGSGFGG